MIKLLLIIILAVLLFAAGVYNFSIKETKLPGSTGTTPQYSSPTDAIRGAGDAVNQTQNLQDRINQKAQEQLDN